MLIYLSFCLFNHDASFGWALLFVFYYIML